MKLFIFEGYHQLDVEFLLALRHREKALPEGNPLPHGKLVMELHRKLRCGYPSEKAEQTRAHPLVSAISWILELDKDRPVGGRRPLEEAIDPRLVENLIRSAQTSS